ncbi:MAG: VWA domain-containing protein [Glaciecola sp.]
MLRKRAENGFNLAFLDVMACGLGAVLLILIIVNFNDDTPIPSDEIERLEQELAATQTQLQNTQNNIIQQQQQTADAQANADDDATRVAQLEIEQQSLAQAIASQQAVIADLQDAIAATAPDTANDQVATPQVKEETYLLGLIVEGPRIGILIDTSASMTDEALIDIIKRKAMGNDTLAKQGPKWQRTVRVAKWMLARLPESSQVSVVSFNETASVLGNQSVNSARVSASIERLYQDIDALVPQKGTNLQAGIEEMARAMPNFTDLYIITDGLPSLLNTSSGFNASRSCKPFVGQQSTITGKCRVEVFNRTLSISPISGVKTNVVLLPLEGDPQAAALYWQWANYTGGTLISPAGTWP